MKRIAAVAFSLMTLMLAGERPITGGAKLFVEPMENGLDGFIRAEITKEKLPIVLVIDKDSADLIMVGNSSERDRKWHEGWLTTTKDHAEGSISIIDPKSKTIVWSSEAGDRSLWKGNLARGGTRKVAERLVNNLRGSIQKN